MAFTKCKERCKNERYKATTAIREHTREFVIESDADITPYAARLASHGGTTLPLVGDVHPSDAGSYCVDVEIKRMSEGSAAPFIYEAACQYSSETRLITVATSPLLRPWKYSGTTGSDTEDFLEDKTTPTPLQVVNSAWEPFDTLPQRLAKGMSVTVTRNQGTSPAALLDVYDKTSNSGSVTIDGYSYPAKSLLMESINWEKVTEDGTDYYTVTFSMKVRNGDWHMRVADRGYSQLDGSSQRLPIIDGTGAVVTKPWPLDGTGLKLPNADDDPAVLDFLPYSEISWAGLSFV